MDTKQKINQLLAQDSASKAIGIRLNDLTANGIEMGLVVTEKETNGYGICHGGVVFTLADTALAFACVAVGETALTQSAQIDYISSAQLGDELRATTELISQRKRNICCDVKIVNQQNQLIALVRGRQLVVTR